MIKLLKIASFIAVIAAIAVMSLVGLAIYRGTDMHLEREDYLSKDTLIDKLKKISQDQIPSKDKTSPLVGLAETLGSRIDPPPPPPPPPTQNVNKTPAVAMKDPTVAVAKATPIINKNFKLVGTCLYEDFPEKSIAMIDVTSEGIKFFRQGDIIGIHEIHEIRDGSIVVYQNGRESGIYEMPREPQSPSLLKSDIGNTTAIRSGTVGSNSVSNIVPGSRSVRSVRTSTGATTNSARSSRSGGTTYVPTNSRTRRPSAPVKLTAEEKKAQREKSISAIKNIIKETDSSKEDKKAAEGWMQLLKLLEEEGKTDKKPNESNNKNSIPTPPAKDK